MKQILCAALLLLSLLLICSCEGQTPPGGADKSSAVTNDPDFVLSGEGAPEYIIVRGDIAPQTEIDASIYLRKQLKELGVDVKITTDWEKNPVSDHEIVVGSTTRGETFGGPGIDAHDLGEQGFYVAASGTRVYLEGGSPSATLSAVEFFLSEFYGSEPVGTVTIPGGYRHIVKQEFPVTGITVAGVDLKEFKIVVENRASSKNMDAAKQIQSIFYKQCGIWLDIDNSSENGVHEGHAVVLSDKPGSTPKGFTAAAENGDLVLKTALAGSHLRGFKRFFEDMIAGKTGEVRLMADLKYDTDVGSYVTYMEFGAKGDGVTNDIKAIIATHEYANTAGIAVRGDEGATYYISTADAGAVVMTDVDWTGCSFIIDDSSVGIDKRGVGIFNVKSTQTAYTKDGSGMKLKAGQANIGFTLPEDSIVVLTNSNVKHYIREGKNANDGSAQTDVLVVKKDGTVDPAAPIMWDYDAVTGINVTPMDEKTLTLKGGTFTTIANNQPSASNYYNRGIIINRSNVVVDGITHYVKGEGSQGAPYSGILVIQSCANITVQNCTFTAHKTYSNNAKGLGTVSQGTYDISPSRVINLTFRDCTQTTDILNTAYWGVMGSNFCKNITLENCVFSRFDAHQGVANVTIRGCTLGHQCLNAIGTGTLLVEDTTLYGNQLINLRSDYGSTWHGDAIIRNCKWIPNKGNTLTNSTYSIISGSYSGFHDFGYECYMPTNVIIENLTVDDSKHNNTYAGITIFANITPDNTGENYDYKVRSSGFPYHVTEKVTISGLTCLSGLQWKLSLNTYMYRNVVVVEQK